MKNFAWITAALLLWTGCGPDDDKDHEPEKELIHAVSFDEPQYVHYIHPVEIDMNGDSLVDFVFSVALVYTDGAVHNQFVVNSLRDGRVKLQEEMTLIYPKDTVIGSQVTDSTWSIFTGRLMERTDRENQEPQWSGPLFEASEGYLAVSIRINSAYHYGWIKLLADPEHSEILIQEYAIHLVPGETIKTGQTE